jgi:hypothetical protein
VLRGNDSERDRVAAGVRELLSAKDVAEGQRERRGRVGGMVVKSKDATINLPQTINKMACAHGPMHVLMAQLQTRRPIRKLSIARYSPTAIMRRHELISADDDLIRPHERV